MIEDAGQAHGAEYKGRRAGSIGDIGLLQLLPGQEPRRLRRRRRGRHQRRRACAKTIRMLRDWGQEKRYHHVLKGFNYRMDGIQGAILRVKLRYLEAGPRRGARTPRDYDALLRRLRRRRRRSQLAGPPARLSHLRGAHRRPRRAAARACSRAGVQTGLHYPIPVHLQQALSPISATSRATSRCRRRAARRSAVAADVPGDDDGTAGATSVAALQRVPASTDGSTGT